MGHEKIGLHILGGLGDVSLTRKYPMLLQTDLSHYFEIVSIADIYPNERVATSDNIRALLEYIKKQRLKGKFPQDLQTIFENELINSIEYTQLSTEDPILSSEFFARIRPDDVIDVSVPNKMHLPLAKQVLERKGNLLIEKPLCSSLEDAVRFEEQIARLDLNGRVLTDAEHYSHYGNIKMFYNNFQRFSHDTRDGFGFGKITSLYLAIEEDESFESERNQQIIEIAKSGGGIWLDTGIHAISFLKSLGAIIDHNTIEAQPYKSNDPGIQDPKHGETSMEVHFDIFPNEYFAPSCHVSISVGKCFEKKKKLFSVQYEKGRIDLNMTNKSLRAISRNGSEQLNAYLPQDAFYYVFDDLRKSIINKQAPFTSISKALQSVKDVFLIYDRAKPLIKGHTNKQVN